MRLTSAGGFFIVLLSVKVVQGQQGWGVTYTSTNICVLKGTSVTFNCTYTYPPRINGKNITVTRTLWFTREEDITRVVDLKEECDRADRVQYVCHENRCALTISDLRHNDSAQYWFRFITNHPQGSYSGSPGVCLSVTDLQVRVSRASPCTDDTCVSAELRCQTSCHLPHGHRYVWIKNGKEIHTHASSSYLTYIYSTDTVACAVEGYEMFSSPSVYPPITPSVSYGRPGDITEGSSVTLTCSSDANPPVTKYTWYKKTIVTEQHLVSGNNHLVFDSIQSSDSGTYYCTAKNKLMERASAFICVDVKYPPRRPSVSVHPSGLIVEGSSVTLTCTGDANPTAQYTWYKEDDDSPTASGQNFTITDVRSEHSGSYYCEAQNSRGRQNSTSHLVAVSAETKNIVIIVKLSVLVLMPCALIFSSLCFRKKKSRHRHPEPTPLEPIELDPFPIYENISSTRKAET